MWRWLFGKSKAKEKEESITPDSNPDLKRDSSVLDGIWTEAPLLGPEAAKVVNKISQKIHKKKRLGLPGIEEKVFDGSTSDLSPDSPFYILALAARGKYEELERLLAADKATIEVKDNRGRDAFFYAAKSGQVVVMELLLSYGSDINAKDTEGNTALHAAVEQDQKKSLDFLLAHKADPTILNKRAMAPIHLAVDLDRTDTLEELLNHDAVDPNLIGENGSTPLHYAAWKDHPKCARILLAHKAKLCRPCNIGLYPMHVAAQSSSTATLEVLIEYAEKKGCATRCELLAKLNQEKNTPLHAAVMGGDINIVKMCLLAGAEIDTKQENGCTPVHLAAAQGSLDMIRMMFENQPHKKVACLMSTDNLGLTPLHKAAMLDRMQTVEFLIDEGAEINSRSNDGQTPVLLAASKCAWSSVNALIKAKADITVKDLSNRNILHLIIRGGGQPSQFDICLCKQSIAKLLNEQDQFGCTPLHYASKQGQLKTIDQLLELGAHLNAKNNKQQSALHFAARYGRHNTCQRLLSSVLGVNIINETDGSGQTALHLAAEGGHVNVVKLLLQRGSGVFKDVHGNTALHLAARNGFTHTITAILNVHSYLLDSSNKLKNTCLHLAAIEGHPNVVTLLLNMGAKITLNEDGLHALDLGIEQGKKDVCVAIIAHDRWREAMDMRSRLYGCPMVGMIQHMPEVCQMILDRCRVPSGPDPRDKDFHHIYDFRYMQVELNTLRKMRKQGVNILPMFALNMMVKYNRVECLSHPVCIGFLAMKWCAYGLWFHMANLFIYLAFLSCLTAFVAMYDFCSFMPVVIEREVSIENETDPDSLPENICIENQQVVMTHGQKFLVFVILVFCVVNAIKEILQMIQQKMTYLGDINNALEWVLYITSAAFVGPFLVDRSFSLQWQCGAIAIFLAWFNLLVFLQRFDVFGIYVVMFLEILKTLLQVITVFSVLIIAFGFAFYILLKSGTTPGFSSPEVSLLSASIMMLGSIDYLDVWIGPYSRHQLPNPELNFVMLLIFILLMPILLINLLIGLAVGDIESVQKNARLKRIAMQVQLHTDLEQKLPKRFLQLVDKSTIKVYPNTRCGIWQKIKNKITKQKTDEPSERYHTNDDTSETLEHHSYLYRELHQQKTRMKKISSDLTKHYDLLRMIVQKMEIHTEADDFDEGSGGYPAEVAPPVNAAGSNGEKNTGPSIGWSSSALRHEMLKQAFVISKWTKKSTD